MRYDAAIFDLFGTLIENFTSEGYRQTLYQMATALDVPADEFSRAWSASNDDRMVGRFGSEEGNILQVCSRIAAQPEPGLIAAAVDIRRDFTRRNMGPRDGGPETLAHLKSMGCKIGLVSDCTTEVPTIWSTTAFASLIDVTIFSCVEGVKKPDPRIYRLACERLAVDPRKCLYVGDGSNQELTGALQVGMEPVLIRGPEITLSGVDRSDANTWPVLAVSSLNEVLGFITE